MQRFPHAHPPAQPNPACADWGNNFNCYSSGLVTIFNLLVVNDWSSIALVFTDRSVGREWVAYAYFIFVNL